MKKFLTIFSVLSFSLFFIGAKWQNYKTERVKIADEVVLEKKVASSTGKVISEEYKVIIDGNYWDAQFKDGKWILSPMGQEMYDEFKRSGDTGGGGGGCN